MFRLLHFLQSQLTLGWFIAICMLYQSIVSPAKMGDRNYVYNRLDAANYGAFAPITWCSFFAWIIFTSHTGNGGNVFYIISVTNICRTCSPLNDTEENSLKEIQKVFLLRLI
jgi:hypothetical protein